jgi:hypothetical protein
MKSFLQLALLFLCSSCSTSQTELGQSGEAKFRITMNYGREVTDAEQDSIENSKPFYTESFRENEFYDLLVRKGFVSNEILDTTGLNFALITWEEPSAIFGATEVLLDTSYGMDHIVVRGNGRTSKTDLGTRLLGDILVSYLDIDGDEVAELLVMKKYYAMGGYNFDLKAFDLR